jgi:hypothetical protein
MAGDSPIPDLFLIEGLPLLLVGATVLLVAKSRSQTSEDLRGKKSDAMDKRGLTLVLLALPVWLYVYLYIGSAHHGIWHVNIPLGPNILFKVAVRVALYFSVLGFGALIVHFTEWIRKRLHG